jgi:hypothetical protein
MLGGEVLNWMRNRVQERVSVLLMIGRIDESDVVATFNADVVDLP